MLFLSMLGESSGLRGDDQSTVSPMGGAVKYCPEGKSWLICYVYTLLGMKFCPGEKKNND